MGLPLGALTVITTACGVHCRRPAGPRSWAANGKTSTRQRWPAICPDRVPGTNSSLDGRAVIMVRAVSNRVKCASIERLPRALLAISAPIDANATATIARATTASISVNPAVPLCAVDCDNLDPSRQPIHAHLVAHPQPAKRNDSATGHPC
jgi:hypothetical protein